MWLEGLHESFLRMGPSGLFEGFSEAGGLSESSTAIELGKLSEDGVAKSPPSESKCTASSVRTKRVERRAIVKGAYGIDTYTPLFIIVCAVCCWADCSSVLTVSVSINPGCS